MTEPQMTTAQILGAYRAELLNQSINSEVVDLLIRDAAHWLINEGDGIRVRTRVGEPTKGDDTCDGCGHDRRQSEDPNTRGQWRVVANRCFACDAIARRRDQMERRANHPDAIHYHAELA